MEPKNWNVYLFRDILERVEVPVNVESNKEYVQIGIRSHGKGLFYKEPVLGKALGNKQVFWIQPNCFILNVVFAWEQAITKTTENEIGMIGSHRFPMYRPKNDLVDIDYLIYYFLTKRGTDILEAASPGGAGRNRTLGQERFLKSKITCSLQLDIVTDKQGNTLEITFKFRNNDPVMTKFDPDRLYQLEQNLKKILKLNPSKADSSIKNMKYIQAISYKDLK